MEIRKRENGVAKIIIVVAAYLIVILGLATFFAVRSHRIMDELLKNEMIEVARSAASMVDGDKLSSLQKGDESTDAYEKIYDTLTVFLMETEAKYVYAIRCDGPGKYSFILDTDPVDPGKFGESVEETPATAKAASGIPSVDEEPYQDRWGSFYSAYTPVYDSAGELAGIICADFPADWFDSEVSTQLWLLLLLGTTAIVFCGLILVLVLINARREAANKVREHEELTVAKSMVLEANERRNEFLKMMSHEIRTPINMVMGMDEMILRESVEPDVRKDATEIRHAGNLLLSLVDEVLDMSKVEDGSSDPEPVRYDPLLMISDVTEMIRGRMRRSEVKFITEVDDNLPSILFGDSKMIRRCLVNLLNNSVRYTRQGEIHFTVTRKRIEGGYVWLYFSVSDTGEGVPEDAVNRMVEAFEQGDYSEDAYMSGITELGLTMVNKHLRQMDSKLEFVSEVGKGSTFSFVLRQRVIDEKPIGDFAKARETMAASEQSTEHRSYTAPEAKLLMVDDEEMNLQVVKSLLRSTKIQIDATESGATALELLAENEYDILVFDHLMPEIDGIELMRLIRENHGNPNSTAPCIVLTANAEEGAREVYLKVGFDAYLAKPVNKELLEGVLLRYLPRDKVKFIS